MSMQPRPWPEVPADTARVARRAFRKGTLAIRARDELGAWYDDGAFAGACGARGKPGISPAQLAMVTVLQFTENLTDRRAADAVRGRLDWKYCLGLAVEDEGFDFSVLSEFRARLVAGSLELTILDLLLDRLEGLGLVAAGGWSGGRPASMASRRAEPCGRGAGSVRGAGAGPRAGVRCRGPGNAQRPQ